jgi:mannose-6-phosphate isomerase-like protein (cupin superfamily)
MKKIERPWGWYRTLLSKDGYKVKEIYVKKNQQISLQYHHHRSEHWIVVTGNGKVEVDAGVKDITVGDYIFIPVESKHRIYGENGGIMIVEVQIGSLCDENDIVRIQDDYGRV